MGQYYTVLGKKDIYFDNSNKGKFLKWIEDNEYDIDDVDEELKEGNVNDCGYLEFDDNFPFNIIITNERKKQIKMFEIIRYCYLYGKCPPFKGIQSVLFCGFCLLLTIHVMYSPRPSCTSN